MKVNLGPYKSHDEEGDRVIHVHVDDYDIWNMDHTMALIIHPLLLKFRENHHGAPRVDNEDVPEDLYRPDDVDEFDTDEHYFERYDYILDEMIWAFNVLVNENYLSLDASDDERCSNGLRLFGKYFRSLWD